MFASSKQKAEAFSIVSLIDHARTYPNAINAEGRYNTELADNGEETINKNMEKEQKINDEFSDFPHAEVWSAVTLWNEKKNDT